MNTKVRLLLFIALCSPFAASALDDKIALKVTQLLKTTTSWDGKQIVFPKGQGERGVAIFAKAFMGIPAQQAAKTTRPLMPAAAPAVLLLLLDTQQGVSNIILAMTRRDVGKPAFSLRKLRENTCTIASGDYSTPVSQRVTTLIVEIAPEAETGWHEHPVPSFAYIMAGELKLTLVTGEIKFLHAGDVLPESVGVLHNGRNIGKEPVKILVFYMGEVGAKLSVAHPEFVPPPLSELPK